jgi:hypothetical protein
MLVRVRNFGTTHSALFASSPVAQETFAAIGTAVDELATTSQQKMSASAAARADRKAAARRALADLLQRAQHLASNLRADGRALPALALPVSRSDVSLVTAGRKFAADVAPYDAAFSGHGVGAAHITAATDALVAAQDDQGASRSQHVAARVRIQELLATAIRGAQRLDLIVLTDRGHDPVVQAQWQQLRRIERTRVPRRRDELDLGPASPGETAQMPLAVAVDGGATPTL